MVVNFTNNHHKQILLEAIQHRVKSGLLTVYAFVIMPNHFHIIWRINGDNDRIAFQRDFMKFTARSILKFMFMNDDPMLPKLQEEYYWRSAKFYEAGGHDDFDMLTHFRD